MFSAMDERQLKQLNELNERIDAILRGVSFTSSPLPKKAGILRFTPQECLFFA